MRKGFFPQIKFQKHKPLEQQQQQKPKINPPVAFHQGIQVNKAMQGILLPSFVTLILGKPGSGKTSLLSQLLTRKQFYSGKFDRILYITPSNIQGIQHNQEINTCRSLDAKWIFQKIRQCSNWCQQMLIVIDDVVADIPSSQRNQLKTLFYDRRHLLPKGCISILITSQKYNCAPLWIRVCLNTLISFGVQPNQVKNISNQLNTGKDKKHLEYLFRLLKKHQFLLFNLQEGTAYDYQFNKI